MDIKSYWIWTSKVIAQAIALAAGARQKVTYRSSGSYVLQFGLITCSLAVWLCCMSNSKFPSTEIFIRLKGSLSTSICVTFSFFEQHGLLEVCDLLCFCCFDTEISWAILTQHTSTTQTSVLYVELMVALEKTESSTHFTTTSKTRILCIWQMGALPLDGWQQLHPSHLGLEVNVLIFQFFLTVPFKHGGCNRPAVKSIQLSPQMSRSRTSRISRISVLTMSVNVNFCDYCHLVALVCHWLLR